MSESAAHSPEPPAWGAHHYRYQHQPLLGTFVEVRVPAATEPSTADEIDDAVISEIERLQLVLSAFDPASELERWKRGEIDSPSVEFSAAMRLALDWQSRSGGTFNTSSGTVSAAWRRAELAGQPPTPVELAALASAIAEPRFVIDDNGRPVPVGDCSGVNLNAFAKGWIVDRGVDAARAIHPEIDVLVNAGGDLRHVGTAPLRVGIENPLRAFDNEPPVVVVNLDNAGLATSGRARRGFRVANEWHSHVIDPRTGATVDSTASISILAEDAATADVLATIAGLMPTSEALAYTSSLGAGCLIVDASGVLHSNRLWDAVEVSRR